LELIIRQWDSTILSTNHDSLLLDEQQGHNKPPMCCLWKHYYYLHPMIGIDFDTIHQAISYATYIVQCDIELLQQEEYDNRRRIQLEQRRQFEQLLSGDAYDPMNSSNDHNDSFRFENDHNDDAYFCLRKQNISCKERIYSIRILCQPDKIHYVSNSIVVPINDNIATLSIEAWSSLPKHTHIGHVDNDLHQFYSHTPFSLLLYNLVIRKYNSDTE
jgi:hypothetical protein